MRPTILSLAFVSLSCLAAPMPAVPQAEQPAPEAAAEPGDLFWRNGSMTLRLSEQPCRFRQLADALELSEGMPQAPQAAVIAQARRGAVPACWVLDVNGDVVLRDAGGNEGFIPMEWFERQVSRPR